MKDARKTAIIDILKSMNNDALVSIWNEHCYDHGDPNDALMENYGDSLEEMFSGHKHPVEEALRAASYGDYRYDDSYVKFNAYGNLVSISEYDVNDNIDFDELADDIMDNNDCYEIKEVWYDDMVDAFVDWYNASHTNEISYDDYMDKEAEEGFSLITDEWETIAENF